MGPIFDFEINDARHFFVQYVECFCFNAQLLLFVQRDKFIIIQFCRRRCRCHLSVVIFNLLVLCWLRIWYCNYYFRHFSQQRQIKMLIRSCFHCHLVCVCFARAVGRFSRSHLASNGKIKSQRRFAAGEKRVVQLYNWHGDKRQTISRDCDQLVRNSRALPCVCAAEYSVSICLAWNASREMFLFLWQNFVLCFLSF